MGSVTVGASRGGVLDLALLPDQAHSSFADALAALGRETWSVILSALAPDFQTSQVPTALIAVVANGPDQRRQSQSSRRRRARPRAGSFRSWPPGTRGHRTP